MQQIQLPPLEEGETYLFSISDRHGELTHIVLLPGDNDSLSQDDQLAWAASIGGDLMTPAESQLALETHPEKFKKTAYWTNKRIDSAYGLYTDFDNGGTRWDYRRSKLRGRAVRRIKD